MQAKRRYDHAEFSRNEKSLEKEASFAKMSNHEDETIASGQKKQRSANHHGFPSHVWKQRFSLLLCTILHHFLKRLSFNFGRYYKMSAMGRFLIDEKNE